MTIHWSLSEFLSLLVIRSQCWCFVELDEDAGFNVPHNNAILFYAVLGGEVGISGMPEGTLTLQAGDMAMIASGDAHAVRIRHDSKVEVLDFLCANEYVDMPARFKVGEGRSKARLLCSRLKVRWPAGQKPEVMPSVLRIKGENSAICTGKLEQLASKAGASVVLTRAAALLFTEAFRDYHECDALYRSFYKHDPILRARQFLELHPFHDWTVEALAHKVGMGRSNFATRFSLEVGRTPMELLTEERMKHAVRLLEKTDLKIAAISDYIGYRSEAAFSRRFTASYGVSPGKMRKMIQQKSVGATLSTIPSFEGRRSGSSSGDGYLMASL